MTVSNRSAALAGVLSVLVFGIGFAVATGREPIGPHELDAPVQSASAVAEGGEIYRAQCAACHQSAGVGGALSYADNAPSLADTHPVEIAAAIRGGPGEMPSFEPELLSDEQLGQVVTYVLYLQDPGAPGGAPLSSVGPVSEGAVAWLVGVPALLVALRWIGRRDD